MRCHFCNRDVSKSDLRVIGTTPISRTCRVCGIVNLTEEAALNLKTHISDEQKHIISIC